MADPITTLDLPVVTAIDGSEQFAIVQGGTDKRLRVDQFLAATSTNLTTLTLTDLTVTSTATIAGLTVTAGVRASSGTFTGGITASSATITNNLTAGSLNTSSGTFTGAITASSGTFTNNLTAGNVTASSGTFTGGVSASSVTVTNNISAGNVSASSGTFTGAVSASSATISNNLNVGTLTGSSGTFTGPVSGSSASFTNNVTAGSLTATSTATLQTATITSSLTVGSSTSLTVLNSKSITRPNMPAFSAVSTAGQASVTGNTTAVTVAFQTELYDRGDDFAGNTFTAPVTGVYAFSGAVEATALTSNHTSVTLHLVTTTTTYLVGSVALSTADAVYGVRSLPFATSALMTSGNTATMRLTVSGASGGAGVAGSAAATPLSWFTGHLIG